MNVVTFGEGGYCEDCNPSHDHPLHNIVDQYEMPAESDPAELAREAAMEKLMKLGLTEAEVLALIGARGSNGIS